MWLLCVVARRFAETCVPGLRCPWCSVPLAPQGSSGSGQGVLRWPARLHGRRRTKGVGLSSSRTRAQERLPPMSLPTSADSATVASASQQLSGDRGCGPAGEAGKTAEVPTAVPAPLARGYPFAGPARRAPGRDRCRTRPPTRPSATGCDRGPLQRDATQRATTRSRCTDRWTAHPARASWCSPLSRRTPYPHRGVSDMPTSPRVRCHFRHPLSWLRTR